MDKTDYMRLALELAVRGQGFAEPNPMVGAVIVKNGRILGQGFHTRYGFPHAEIEAIHAATGVWFWGAPNESGTLSRQRTSPDTAPILSEPQKQALSVLRGADMYVTLEPCCHWGKTPPCSEALVRCGFRKVFVAMRDPNPKVNGGGLGQLQEAGIEVETGILESKALALNAPFVKLITTGRPWVIAKWAMTLDGKIASRTGSSRWISNELSREVVQRLRARVDAVVVGAGTFLADNPTLLARLESVPRKAARIVAGLRGEPSPDCNLLKTADQGPVDFLPCSDCSEFLDELGNRRYTNILVEGGGKFLGRLFDAGLIDEVHAFVCPKLCGGATAPSPIAGGGLEQMERALELKNIQIQTFGTDVYIQGRL